MTTVTTGVKLKSKPYKKRSGLIPMTIALAVGFLFSCLWLITAGWLILQPANELRIWGIVIAMCTLAYCGYLSLCAYRLMGDGKRAYFVELTDSEVVLNVVDHLHHKRGTNMVLLNDVKYAEYYPFPDSASVILHTSYASMEVPLWPFGSQAQDVIDFLEGSGVRIINVISDDPIPD
jgi:hypothetical protein